jgi:hypothetical protein
LPSVKTSSNRLPLKSILKQGFEREIPLMRLCYKNGPFVGSGLLCSSRRARYGGVTQTEQPPANPARFNQMQEVMKDLGQKAKDAKLKKTLEDTRGSAD